MGNPLCYRFGEGGGEVKRTLQVDLKMCREERGGKWWSRVKAPVWRFHAPEYKWHPVASLFVNTAYRPCTSLHCSLHNCIYAVVECISEML